MSFEEERMQILKMLAEGKITAEETAQLLSALEVGAETEHKNDEAHHFTKKGRRVRIAVTDSRSGKQKVNVNLPVGLVKMVKKMRGKFSPDIEGLDLDEVFAAIEEDIPGKIIDVQENDKGKRVEIFVE